MMGEEIDNDWFEGIETIVADPLRFKFKLAIGEDAYTSLRVKNAVTELWDVAGAASTAVGIAKSTAIASTFFAPSGMLAVFGFGAAVTPIGWVVAAGLVGAGGWLGVTRCLKQTTGSRVKTIPDFINTPLDVLALGLFDLMAPLALKVASIDGEIDESERNVISGYFVKEWGYDSDFVHDGMAYTEKRVAEFSVKNLAQTLGEFQKQNRDCNFKEMTKELVTFLREVSEADGQIDEREEMAIERVQAAFDDVASLKLKETAQKGYDTVAVAAKGGIDMTSDFVKRCAVKASEIAKKISAMSFLIKNDKRGEFEE